MAQFENCEAENLKLDGNEEGGGELLVAIKGESRAETPSTSEEPINAPLETLEGRPLVQSPKNKQMKGLLVISAALDGDESMEEIKGSRKQLTPSGTAKEVQPKIKTEFQSSGRSTPPSELSPSSCSISSATDLTLKNKVFQPKNNGDYKFGLNLQKAPDLRIESAFATAKVPASDGYNWRKYGQKEVKSPKGFRSYYRCSNTECCAKKIECSDDLGCMIEIVYKSKHCHDPPAKINSTRQSKRPSSSEATSCNIGAVHSSNRLEDFNLTTTSSKEPRAETPSTSEGKQETTHNYGEIVEISIKEVHDNGSEPKQRTKEQEMEYSDSLKPGKKPKFLVQAVGKEGTFSDGYRWRKYGQKMVKGNPHPRNYYRCTAAGCPVRKHTITAIDNPCTITMAYKGTHDHEMPVPRKSSIPSPIASIAPMKDSNLNNAEMFPSKMSQVQAEKEKELIDETLDLRGEKTMESARTLLSIGFEIKQC